jgi:hypothetical protein
MLLRRFLVLAALMFWQGGFTFYSTAVIHAGHQVLGSVRTQGFVTRQVTNYLNASGAVALLVLAWDAAAARPGAGRRLRRLCWAVMTASLGLLAWLHVRLDSLLDPGAFSVLDPRGFYAAHRAYLLASTVQWAGALFYAVLALRDWGDEDRAAAAPLS